jgi:hypothetical protein
MKTCAAIRSSESISSARNPSRSQFSIGDVTVEVLGDSPDDVVIAPSLRPFETDIDQSDISISVEWVSELPAQKKVQSFDSGTTWRCHNGEAGLEFDFHSPAFGRRPYKRLHVDRSFERATLQMNEAVFADFPARAEPLEYPLDELLIMHRLTQEDAIELHACGIVRADGVGNLFVGHSGAGKSTTTRLWTEREPVEVLSDDRIIVRTDEGHLLNSANNFRDTTRGDGSNDRMRVFGTPWHGEAMYASPGDAPLGAIFVLEHGHGNRLTELTPSDAVAELFARSFVPFHRHEYVDAALQFLQQIVAAVPCYRYEFEPNQAAVETILSLRD